MNYNSICMRFIDMTLLSCQIGFYNLLSVDSEMFAPFIMSLSKFHFLHPWYKTLKTVSIVPSLVQLNTVSIVPSLVWLLSFFSHFPLLITLDFITYIVRSEYVMHNVQIVSSARCPVGFLRVSFLLAYVFCMWSLYFFAQFVWTLLFVKCITIVIQNETLLANSAFWDFPAWRILAKTCPFLFSKALCYKAKWCSP